VGREVIGIEMGWNVWGGCVGLRRSTSEEGMWGVVVVRYNIV
jgi:hypothetical protein